MTHLELGDRVVHLNAAINGTGTVVSLQSGSIPEARVYWDAIGGTLEHHQRYLALAEAEPKNIYVLSFQPSNGFASTVGTFSTEKKAQDFRDAIIADRTDVSIYTEDFVIFEEPLDPTDASLVVL